MSAEDNIDGMPPEADFIDPTSMGAEHPDLITEADVPTDANPRRDAILADVVPQSEHWSPSNKAVEIVNAPRPEFKDRPGVIELAHHERKQITGEPAMSQAEMKTVFGVEGFSLLARLEIAGSSYAVLKEPMDAAINQHRDRLFVTPMKGDYDSKPGVDTFDLEPNPIKDPSKGMFEFTDRQVKVGGSVYTNTSQLGKSPDVVVPTIPEDEGGRFTLRAMRDEEDGSITGFEVEDHSREGTIIDHAMIYRAGEPGENLADAA